MKNALQCLFALGAVSMLAAANSADAAEKVYGVEIAPDGKHYAVLRDAGDQRAIVIHSADDAAVKASGIGLGKNEIDEWEWGGSDHVLVRISGEVGGVDTNAGVKTINYSRWLSISRASGEFRTLFGNEQGADYFYYIASAGALMSSLPRGDGRALFARSYAAVKPTGPSRLKQGVDELLYSLLEANLQTGDIKRVAEGESNTIDWIVDADGAPVARIDQYKDSKNVEILAAGVGGKGFKKAGEISGKTMVDEEIVFFGRGSTPRSIQLVRKIDRGLRFSEFDLDSGVIRDGPAIPGPLNRVAYDQSAARARIVFYSTGSGERPFHLDADDQATQAKLEKALPGASVSIDSKSVDGARMIAKAAYADKGEEYYFFEKAAKRLELVATN